MKDRLASKELRLSESNSSAQQRAGIAAGQGRKPGSVPGTASSSADCDQELLKLYQEREELVAQMERLRAQNLALNRNLINSNRRGDELQAKIQDTVRREAASHARVLELTDSLRNAGLTVPLGAQQSPEEQRQFESDRKAFLMGGADVVDSKTNGDELPQGKEGRESIEEALAAEVEGLQRDASRALSQNEQTIHELHKALDSATRASAELEESLAQVMAERDEARDELAAVAQSKAAGSHVLDAWKVRRLPARLL